jgi:hypothetical protein
MEFFQSIPGFYFGLDDDFRSLVVGFTQFSSHHKLAALEEVLHVVAVRHVIEGVTNVAESDLVQQRAGQLTVKLFDLESIL